MIYICFLVVDKGGQATNCWSDCCVWVTDQGVIGRGARRHMNRRPCDSGSCADVAAFRAARVPRTTSDRPHLGSGTTLRRTRSCMPEPTGFGETGLSPREAPEEGRTPRGRTLEIASCYMGLLTVELYVASARARGPVLYNVIIFTFAPLVRGPTNLPLAMTPRTDGNPCTPMHQAPGTFLRIAVAPGCPTPQTHGADPR